MELLSSLLFSCFVLFSSIMGLSLMFSTVICSLFIFFGLTYRTNQDEDEYKDKNLLIGKADAECLLIHTKNLIKYAQELCNISRQEEYLELRKFEVRSRGFLFL